MAMVSLHSLGWSIDVGVIDLLALFLIEFYRSRLGNRTCTAGGLAENPAKGSLTQSSSIFIRIENVVKKVDLKCSEQLPWSKTPSGIRIL